METSVFEASMNVRLARVKRNVPAPRGAAEGVADMPGGTDAANGFAGTMPARHLDDLGVEFVWQRGTDIPHLGVR